MAKTESTLTEVILLETDVQNQIYNIRGLNVMIDSDLATLYGLETKVLNQAVRRNIERFPIDFMFQLTKEEWTNLRSQIVTASWGGLSDNVFTFSQRKTMLRLNREGYIVNE